MRKTYFIVVLCLPLCFSAYAQSLDTLFASSISARQGEQVEIILNLKNGSFPVAGMTFELQASDSVNLNFAAFDIGDDFLNFEYFYARLSAGSLRVTAIADMPGFARVSPLPIGIHRIGRITINIGNDAPPESNIYFRFIASDGRPCTLTDSTGLNLVYPSVVDGCVRILGATEISEIPVADKFELLENYPNPFNITTKIKFNIKESGIARIDVYDIGGRFIGNIINEHFSAGSHTVIWDGRDENGAYLPSGVYLYRLTAGNFAQTRKLCLLK